MPESTPEKGLDEAAAISEAYLNTLTPVTHPSEAVPAESQPQPIAKPARQWADRFDTSEAMETGYLELRPKMDRLQNEVKGLKPLADLAQKYPALLDAAENAEGFAGYVEQFQGFQEEPKGDERPLTRAEIREEVRAENAEARRQADYEQQLVQAAQKRGITVELATEVLDKFANRKVTVENMLNFETMAEQLAQATNDGRKEVVQKIADNAGRPPAVGAVPGTQEIPQDPSEAEGDAIVASGGKGKMERGFGL